MLYGRGPQIFQKKSSSHSKIVGARWVTRSMFHIEDSKLLGFNVQNLVAWDFFHIGKRYTDLLFPKSTIRSNTKYK
jgi:hypothetical protein